MRVGSSVELWGQRPFVKTMIHGPTGVGKTHWAAGTPRPLFLLREEQGLATINARRGDAQVVIIEEWQDFIESLNAVKLATVGTSKNGQPYCTAEIGGHKMHFQTLVIDSFTDIQKLMIAHVRGVSPEEHLEQEDEDNITRSQWGRIINVCEHVLRDQRAIPCNTVFIFLSTMIQDDRGRMKMVPSVSGRKFPLEIGQYFNGVGYATKDAGNNNLIMWSGDPARWVTKAPCGWPDRTPNTLEAGNVSLGSLMLADLANGTTRLPDGISCPHEETDSAEFVLALNNNTNTEE